jgi:hypothetical protein
MVWPRRMLTGSGECRRHAHQHQLDASSGQRFTVAWSAFALGRPVTPSRLRGDLASHAVASTT